MKRPPAGSVIAVILAAAVYLGYIGLCFGMEPLARSRFRVLSKADIAAGAPQVQRDRAMARMYAWPPYKGYLMIVAAVVLGGTAGAMVVAAKRGASKLGMLLAGIVFLALLSGPWLYALQRAERSFTSFFGATAR